MPKVEAETRGAVHIDSSFHVNGTDSCHHTRYAQAEPSDDGVNTFVQ